VGSRRPGWWWIRTWAAIWWRPDFLHGVWDFVYFKLDRVAARSHAEWCAVLDVELILKW
jgi:hypothetical protein